MLRSRRWKRKYTLDDGDLVGSFYVPALRAAKGYDRLTGYFNARALKLAARGVEGLARNNGLMRLITGCALQPAEIEAVEQGERLRAALERGMEKKPLAPPDADAMDALELLAWMVARGFLQIKVAVPCDEDGLPIPSGAIFHEKSGVVTDAAGDRIAWNGSLNETEAGWLHNWESIHVYTSWAELERTDDEADNFARLWEGRSRRALAFDLPEAARRDLLRFMPEDGEPARLRREEAAPAGADGADGAGGGVWAGIGVGPGAERRSRVWAFIAAAAGMEPGGARVGEATAALTPWPHQIRAFERLYERWPPKLLIADEVGLGKTIQAGLLLRQARLAGRAKRVLILAPKAVLGQWQIELREKFNLNWPIYDGRRLTRCASPALSAEDEREVGRKAWHEEPAVIVSSQLLRRKDRAAELLGEAGPAGDLPPRDLPSWDLIVLDEAHHARSRSAGAARHGGPNTLLRLMRGLKERTQGLLLLTATPMQIHPAEVWDLLDLLGLPPQWTREAFLQFFDDLKREPLAPEALERSAELFRAAERGYGAMDKEAARRASGLEGFRGDRILSALRSPASIPRRQLTADERRAAAAVMRAHTPIRGLVSRHTRELLRRYHKAGMLRARIADREVEDRFVALTPPERALYEAVEEYIARAYKRAGGAERTAVGFVMTIYRRRLASSFRALSRTLQRRLEAMESARRGAPAGAGAAVLEEDAPDDETRDDALDAEEIADMERRALAAEERADVEALLERIRALPPDSKLARLRDELAALRRAGYRQAMVFTQYADTMDFLRGALSGGAGGPRLLCFSGRGGEEPDGGGGWRAIGRDDAKRRFSKGEADVLLCTDAAAEGLNFQFCGALIDYDMPWNPMRVEQRIGRIDRLGQEHRVIRIVNLHYEDTVETDVYRALRGRIKLFETVVGRLRPILAQLPRTIAEAVLEGGGGAGRKAAEDVARQADEAEAEGFDIDAALDEGFAVSERPRAPVEMADLERVLASPELLPPGVEAKPLGKREYALRMPGMRKKLRVTTNPEYYERHAESVELWSPGSPSFPDLAGLPKAEDGPPPKEKTLGELLDALAAKPPKHPVAGR